MVGPLSTAQEVVMSQGDVKVGVWLKPGARYVFQSQSPGDLRNKIIAGHDIADERFRRFEDEITKILEPSKKIECLQDFIEELVGESLIIRDALVDSFIDQARLAGGQSSVECLMSGIPLSYRQFSRRFREYAGFTAKEFNMLERMNAASHALNASDRQITSVAASYGYADHSHFTREFHATVGVLPSEFGDHQAL